MANVAHLHPEQARIVACTVSRDVQNFDLLIDDMDSVFGESWGDLSFSDAVAFFGQPDAKGLQVVALALAGYELPQYADTLREVIQAAKRHHIATILVVESPTADQQRLIADLGADDTLSYPLYEDALAESVQGLRNAPAAPVRPARPASLSTTAAAPPPEHENEPRFEPSPEAPPAPPPVTERTAPKASDDRNGIVLAVHGLAGGVGATTFATNLAWEMATQSKGDTPKVCLIDFDLQFGSVATSLDLQRHEKVFDLLSDSSTIDSDALLQSMTPYGNRLQVLTSPPEMLPLDFITSDDVNHILTLARANFDIVVVDMPTTIVQWTEAVLSQSHSYFTVIELDMRSAQNALRMVRALKAEGLPHEKLRFVLNRAPGFTDLSGKSRAKRLADSLSINLEINLPDGGKPVTNSNDHGQTLAELAPKNPLRKEIAKLAQQLVHQAQPAASGTK